jgi:hypothetical protein
MKRVFLLLVTLGFVTPFLAQEIGTEELSEVVVKPVNYKYLNQINHKADPVPVRLLQKEAAGYIVQDQDFYQDDYSHYTVSFYIPEGKLVAVYDHEGVILRTIERFKNVDVPRAVVRSLKNSYPDWELLSDVYFVTYNQREGAVKRYKLKLRKGEKIIRLKMDEQGQIL